MDSSNAADRRRRLAEAIGPYAAALFVAPSEWPRNGDAHYRYRPSSDILYLTGFTEPECALVLRPGAEKEKTVMFVRPKDPEREVWDGRRAGVEAVVRDLGVDAAHPFAELGTRLPELIGNVDDLYFGLGLAADIDRQVASVIARLRQAERRLGRPPKRVIDPRTVLHEMRLRKSAEEVELLRHAATVTTEAHLNAMRAVRPGVFEFEIEAAIDATFRRHGGFPGYSTIVASGPNATTLHYIDNGRRIAAGDLLLIDAGCELGFYTADVTRTFPCGGKFSTAQRRVYDLVLRIQEEAISMARPGVTLDEIHNRVLDLMTAGMIEFGLLQGEVKERVADKAYKKYYMHRTSHWLGMDVHDAGAYFINEGKGTGRPLEPGMVITVEPGLYIPEDDTSAPAELRGIGVRLEDDLLITDEGHQLLTGEIPKQVADLERICAIR